MKNQQRQTEAAKRDRSVRNGMEPRKTYNFRKRKYECEQHGQDERPTKIPNPKKRRIQREDNEEKTDRSRRTPSARRSNHPTSVGTSKSNVKHGKLQDVKTKETMKRKALKKSKGVHLDVGYETKRAQKVNLSSIQHTKDRKDKINKHTSSKHCQQVKKNREKESLRNQKASLTKQIKQSRTTHPGGKSLTFNKSSHRNNIVVKEEILRSNNDLNSKAESFKKSKAEVIKQTLQGNERILDKKTQNTVTFTEETSAKDFFNLFLTKINVEHHPKVGLEQKFGWIHALGVSEDNLVWVNHFGYTVQLRNTTGEVIRTFELDFRPVFNCCTPSGDLLVTQGYGATKPIITSISREGDVKVLADLSSLATNLCGILCQDEDIFVVAHKAKGKKYFIIKLTENGKVKGVYPTQKSSDDINHIISLNGQIVAIRTFGGGFIPLETNEISSRKINKVDITFYSASASMDKFGNVIMASNTSLFIINPSLEYRHEMATGISAEITSTAVDQENRLWFGTKSGDVYSTKYLK